MTTINFKHVLFLDLSHLKNVTELLKKNYRPLKTTVTKITEGKVLENKNTHGGLTLTNLSNNKQINTQFTLRGSQEIAL